MGGGVLKAVFAAGGSGARYVTQYRQFAGVDFSTDPMLVDKSRSPYALNLISDEGGMPQRRPGWRTLHTLGAGRINGLYRCEFDGTAQLLCHQGSDLWRWDTAVPQLLKSGIADRRSCGFFMQGSFYLLTGAEYLVYDGDSAAEVTGYVPTRLVNCAPAGGGDTVEALNLLSPWWTEEFIGDGSSKVYCLSQQGLDAGTVRCQVMSSAGVWADKAENTDFTVDRALGKVTFTAAPAASAVVNVRLTAAKTIAGSADKVRRSTACAVYNDGVVFVCGAVRGQDFRSGYARPDYFPDDGYDLVGSDETDLVGYCRVGEYLGLLKQPSAQGSTVLLRWNDTETLSDGTKKTVYYKKQGIAGVGALAPQSIGRLLDEPLFLSPRGIFGITSSAITYERTVQARSSFVDSRLTAEENLADACAAEWKGRFLLCVNSRCYVLDSRRRHYPNGAAGGYVYECYYWENIPAVCFLAAGETLYFGTADGRICRFSTDLEGMQRYSDDGAAIPAVWSTCMDDDGSPQRLKTLCKRGCTVTLKPFSRSSAEICLRTERDPDPRLVRTSNLDIFDWQDIDFSRFTFNAASAAQDVVLNTCLRRYRRLQFVIRSSARDEGFGIYQITKTFRLMGPARS